MKLQTLLLRTYSTALTGQSTNARGDSEADNGQKTPLDAAAMLREAAAATEAAVDEQREPEEEAQRQQQHEQVQQARQRKRERRSQGKYAKREGAFVLKGMAEAVAEAIRGGWHYVVDALGSNGDAISDDATDGDSADTGGHGDATVDTGNRRQEETEQIREVEEVEVSPLGLRPPRHCRCQTPPTPHTAVRGCVDIGCRARPTESKTRFTLTQSSFLCFVHTLS